MSDRPKRNRKKSQKQNDADASDQHLQDDDDELLFITIGNYEYDISEVQEWPIEIYDETLSAEFKTIYVLAEGTGYVYWVLTELDGLDEVWEAIPDVLSQKQEEARERLFRATAESSDFEDEGDEEDEETSDFVHESESDDEVVEDEDEDADDDVEFQDSGAQREESTELGLIRSLLRNPETTREERQILLKLEEMNTENDNVENPEIIRNVKNILVYFLLVGRIGRINNAPNS